MLNRPPPYFPQDQLSPPDPKRYRKFKIMMTLLVLAGVGLLTAIGFAIYFLVSWVIS